MNNDDILNIGDWIYEDGYGIVEKISPLYWDIYNHEIYNKGTVLLLHDTL